MITNENTSKWMWYYGDFELYHSQKLHLRRMEGSVVFPAFWYLPTAYTSVRFKKEISIDAEEKICVRANGVGFVMIKDIKYAFDIPILLEPGKYEIQIMVSNLNGLPAAYVEGNSVFSDEDWEVDCYDSDWKKVGTNPLYMEKHITPDSFRFLYRKMNPTVENVKSGVLYDVGEETFAKVYIKHIEMPIKLYFGETKQEAIDTEYSYLYENVNAGNCELDARGFRYIYIPDVEKKDVELEVYHEYLPVTRKAEFDCSDELLKKIWHIAAHTFELNSREFYLDGIKRDRWVWSGDSYQSYFINRYLCLDEDIVRRTLLALGGKGAVKQHINTIMDYTFYWIISVYDYFETTGDIEFVKNIYPRMKEYLDFALSRLDENGFASKVGDDWVFIDWAELDKQGALCAEQMLLLKAMESYVKCSRILNIGCEKYEAECKLLKVRINEYFWDEEKGAFIDSFESGKQNVTRHANIFALLFDYASSKQREAIIENVIMNPNIPQIRTPYFKFYELEVMCNIGRMDIVLEMMKSYWGEMVDAGATSFWEEFQPGIPWEEQLGMYNMKYGKSLCHAWGASPIYLIGRYILGVRPLLPGYKSFEVKPMLDNIEEIKALVPLKNGSVLIEKKDGILKITSDRSGGVFIYNERTYPLKENETISLSVFI